MNDINRDEDICNVTTYPTPNDELKLTRHYSDLAPCGVMPCRPANTHRFVNILRHGYFSQTCDVNLKYFGILTSNNDFIQLIPGFQEDEDIWQCGLIDFGWTWSEAQMRNANRHIDDNYAGDCQNSSKSLKRRRRPNFQVFQVAVIVDITDAFEKHNDKVQSLIREDKFLEWRKTQNNQYFISLIFHSDDVDSITYFGDKTTLEQQLKIKQYLFDYEVLSYDRSLFPPKQRLLTAVGFPNYCALTPNGIFNAISKNERERKQFAEWFRSCKYDRICDDEFMNVQVSSNGIEKVYYNKLKDELVIKAASWFEWVLEDENAPEPLEKRYYLPHGSECRLIEAQIVDPKLIDKVKMENINDVNEKEKRYFELLKEWKGFIQVSIDVTKEFDQFQQILKHHVGEEDKRKWNNRQYFLSNFNYDQTQHTIKQSVYVLLDSKRIYGRDANFNFFVIFKQAHIETAFLMHLCSFFSDLDPFLLVCKRWHYLIGENFVVE